MVVEVVNMVSFTEKEMDRRGWDLQVFFKSRLQQGFSIEEIALSVKDLIHGSDVRIEDVLKALKGLPR
jgi:hypothetical protein